jgi:hypothetical protein
MDVRLRGAGMCWHRIGRVDHRRRVLGQSLVFVKLSCTRRVGDGHLGDG